ncbi:B12-binding domain-containing radical SAM protein [Methylobacterium sp. WSM2598]|uniref:B12-binding domain-containing radical SAM protein n=1 Tax=Methylobacterium sp. WSM2598 TaxID=398261 RepID=UPI00037A473A|nr:radical SAM protein [Methylobacterium sp. WSM2598]
MARVALIYPPGGDPRAPRLPLPALAAALRPAGVAVDLFDLDLEGVLALLRPERLRRAAAALAARPRPEPDSALGRLAALAPDLPDTIEDALATIRDPVRFADPWRLNAARERIYDALDLVSAAAPRRLRYQTEVLRYEVEGVDPSRLSDLLAVTADPAANLFEEHWSEEVFPRLEAGGAYDLVGISLTLRWQLIPGLSLARRLRARGHRVVLGGTAIAKVGEALAGCPAFFAAFAEAVVTREGEAAMLALLDALAGDGDLGRVPNLLYRAGDRVVATPTRVEDYAANPTPDFDGLPLDRYLSPHLVLPVMLGKGCYHDECSFCDIPFINRISPKRYRLRRPETVAEDIDHLAERHGCRHFLLADEALPPRVLGRVAEALEARGRTDCVFSGYARLEPGFTRDLCDRLARVGMRRLYFGLESADQDTLDRMRKGIRVEHAAPVLRHCREAGIRFHVFSMVGFPGETEASARRTLAFFEENAELFDDPGCTLDVHELEILTDTPYFADPDAYGIRFLVPTEGRDFLFGVGTAWESTPGLTRPQIAALLDEAGARLGPLLARCHAWPPVLWPAPEEWALCAAGAWFGRDLPDRLDLPGPADPRRLRLAWNPAAWVRREGGLCRIASRRGALVLDAEWFRRLGETPGFRTSAEILRDLAGPGASPDDLRRTRDTLTALLRQRLLELHPEPEPATEAQIPRPRLPEAACA